MTGPIMVLAALQGLAEALPVSAGAHESLARLVLVPWLWDGARLDAAGMPAPRVAAVACAGSLLAILLVLRARLRGALSAGTARSARARRELGALAIGAAASLMTSEMAVRLVQPWVGSPAAIGVGLLVTAAAVGSLAACPPGNAEALDARGALLAGIVHGLAVLPGASRVGAGLVAAMWLGLRARRALELSLAWTAPALLVAAARDVTRYGVSVDAASIALVLTVSCVATVAGILAARALVDGKKVAVLALWTAPLGLATLAYSRVV